MRREHVGALFLAEDVVAPGEDRRSQLRHERDWRDLAHLRHIRIRIGPEGRYVDVKMRGVGHGVSGRSFYFAIDYRLRTSRASRRYRLAGGRNGLFPAISASPGYLTCRAEALAHAR